MVQVAIDIGMVEFNTGQDGRIRIIMEKLGPFIKEGGIIFIGFNDDAISGTGPIIALEIGQDADDNE